MFNQIQEPFLVHELNQRIKQPIKPTFCP